MAQTLYFNGDVTKAVWKKILAGEAAAGTHKARCSCGNDLFGSMIEGYAHDGGIDVPETPGDIPAGRYWLYVTCPRCEYQMALHKMGYQGPVEV
jgi:hypothetical protein